MIFKIFYHDHVGRGKLATEDTDDIMKFSVYVD